MNGVATPIDTVACSDRVWAQVLSDIGVHGADEVAEGLDGVFLADLHRDAGTSGHLLGHLGEFGQDTLVNFEELLSCRAI